MSSDLASSAALAASGPFRGLIAAAIREHAIAALTDRTGPLEAMWLRHDLAQAVIHDAGAYVEKFAGIVADDVEVSAAAPDVVDPARVRVVVENVWVAVAASTPALR